MLRPYSCQHLEDKLSVIAKNSSPNASPVQLSVVSCQWLEETFKFVLFYSKLQLTTDKEQLTKDKKYDH
jgi:hypothetical protein